AMAARFHRHRLHLDRRIAAETAKDDLQPRGHVVEPHRRIGKVRRRVEAGGEPVPDLADALLRLPRGDFEMSHGGPQPVTATTTSSRPRRISSSSVNGSIIAARMARSKPMPPAIRVAA